MNISNKELMKEAWQMLTGKWGNAIILSLIYLMIISAFQVKSNVGGLNTRFSILSLLVEGPFSLGMSYFFLSLVRSLPARVDQLFDGFKNFGVAFYSYLLRTIFVLLHLLLFIVPGIMKALSYSQTFYILADNPGIEPMQALKTSAAMMDGHKERLFYLWLRFLGLIILSVFTFGIALIWLIPYMNTCAALFYEDLKAHNSPVS